MHSSVSSTRVSVRSVSQLRCFGWGCAALAHIFHTPTLHNRAFSAPSPDLRPPITNNLDPITLFFVSNAIEAGVDFKTIAAWVGHKDGGLLVAKTYGHLRDTHSFEMAQKP